MQLCISVRNRVHSYASPSLAKKLLVSQWLNHDARDGLAHVENGQYEAGDPGFGADELEFIHDGVTFGGIWEIPSKVA